MVQVYCRRGTELSEVNVMKYLCVIRVYQMEDGKIHVEATGNHFYAIAHRLATAITRMAVEMKRRTVV